MNIKVLENNAYRLKVKTDEGGTLLIAQRHYTEQGTTRTGKPFYKGMVWLCFGLCAGRKFTLAGIPATCDSKAALVEAIKKHPSFTIAAHELTNRK